MVKELDVTELEEYLKMSNEEYINLYSGMIAKGQWDSLIQQTQNFDKWLTNVNYSVSKKAGSEELYKLWGESIAISKMINTVCKVYRNQSYLQNKWNSFMRRNNMVNVIRFVYDTPGIRHSELCKKTNLRPNYLTELMTELVDGEFVRKYREGKYSFYELMPKAVEFYSDYFEKVTRRNNEEKEDL